MKTFMLLSGFLASFLLSTIGRAEVIVQVPQNLLCLVTGTGAGTCNIIFTPGAVTSCPNNSTVVFDPEAGVLGKQTYALVLSAIAAGKEVHISVEGCHSSGKANIGWIKI
jgi:hypothetical protein